MAYATLMVHLQLGRPNTGLLQIAGDLAECVHASVIGIAACQPTQILYAEGYVPADLIERDRVEIEKEIKEAEAEFRSALHNRLSSLAWRSTITLGPLAEYLAGEARSADLIIMGVDRDRSSFGPSHDVNLGDVVMEAGRPVLVVPTGTDKLKLDRVLLAWKDTREARRAVSDALPLLKSAAYVAVVEIAAEDELIATRTHLQDVVGWLKRHGVVAEFMASPSTGDDTAQLKAAMQKQDADLVVAGAYGHSRLREWVFGGVTCDLLLRPDRCSLVSH